MTDFSLVIAKELNIEQWQVKNTLTLFEADASIPFISRYRKEMTGSLNEVVIAQIKTKLDKLVEISKRREAILKSMKELEVLTPELESLINKADTLNELEDIYLPFKPKRRTRASIAREKGLEPLAKIIMAQNYIDVESQTENFIQNLDDVENVDEAINGAKDIIAEWANENRHMRNKMRFLFEKRSTITSKLIKGKEEDGHKYEMYFDFDEDLSRAPSHRILGLLRGENEGYLKIKIAPDKEKALDILNSKYIKEDNDCGSIVEDALKDSYKRLLSPSMETEVRAIYKQKADEYAIKVFSDNLRQLLMASPLGKKRLLAIDPGFRTGCKLVVLDEMGSLLHNETIYPHPPQSERKQAMHKIINLIDSYKLEAIAIGNGTAGRETEAMIKKIKFNTDIVAVMVNESGASIYSASKVARDEFPEYDVTVRGSVSIGRRLMDPLAELVKIDPKSIGVGQYQHDVDQNNLQKSLDDTVMSCVNNVGVELNTASKELLCYVSGLGPSLAQNIIDYRNENGQFKSRKELKKVKRFGDKAFEQSAGFLRIMDGENPLDASAVHPESYYIVDKIAKDMGVDINDLIANKALRNKINLKKYISSSIGLPTLEDIIAELEKPGRDPRKKFEFFEFDKNVNKIEDLSSGMELPGIVTNITAFGAFVDVGVHQDGLVHISEITNKFIKDPAEVLSLNQKVKVMVLDVDIKRKRISFSMKRIG